MFVTITPSVALKDIPVARRMCIIFQRLRYDISKLLPCKVIQEKIHCEIPVVYVKEQAAAPLE